MISLNLLDYIFIVVGIILLIITYKMGLLKAIFLSLIIYLGLLMNGLLSESFEGFLATNIAFLDEGSLLTSISATIIIFGLVAVVLAVIIWVIRTFLKFTLFGWVDKVGGILLGLFSSWLLWVAILLGLIIFSERYNQVGIIANVVNADRWVEGLISDSYLVANLVKPIYDVIPAGLFGLIPENLQDSIQNILG